MTISLPPWVPCLVGALVALFGVYRLRLFFTTKPRAGATPDAAAEDAARRQPRGGLYAFSRRTHLLFGVVYLLMGAMLIASAFGVSLWPRGS